MKYSVIIPTVNNISCVMQLADSLENAMCPESEYIFVVHPSNDGTTEYLEALKWPIVIKSDRNTGWVGGINLGIREAKGKFLVLLNDDTLVGVDWLDRLSGAMARLEKKYPGIRCGISGPLCNYVGSELQRDHRFQIPKPTREQVSSYSLSLTDTSVESVGFVSGVCMMIHRELYWKLIDPTSRELLDPRFAPGGYDDNDLCVRAQRAGFRATIARDCFVWHLGGATTKKMGLSPDYNEKAAVFVDKYRGASAPPETLIAAYLVKILEDESDLEKSVKQATQFADGLAVLVDTCGQPEILRKEFASCLKSWAGDKPIQIEFIPPGEPFNERNYRNRLLSLAMQMGATWVICIDADEVFEMDREDALRMMLTPDPQVVGFVFHFFNIWERDLVRVDGFWGIQNDCRMFRVMPNQVITGGHPDTGLHCGSVPSDLPKDWLKTTNIRVIHSGFATPQKRAAKLAWYEERDPGGKYGAERYDSLADAVVTLQPLGPRMRLTLGVIARQEEANIDAFFLNSSYHFDQVVALANNCVDKTEERLSVWASKPVISSGRVSFGELRNQVQEKVDPDSWLIFLDVDERLAPRIPICRLIHSPRVEAYALPIINILPGGEAIWQPAAIRLYRPEFGRWVGSVHEHVRLDDKSTVVELNHPEKQYFIAHFGFLKPREIVQAKKNKYRRLLLDEVKADNRNASAYFYLGLDCFDRDQVAPGLDYMRKAEELGSIDAKRFLGNWYLNEGMRELEEVIRNTPQNHPAYPVLYRTLEVLSQVVPPALDKRRF